MKNQKSEQKVKQIIEEYKINLAKLMRRGNAIEVVSLLNDSGTLSARDKNLYEIAKKSLNATSIEEIEVQRVNFIFSLLSKSEKEIIANEFLIYKPTMWWVGDYSRSSYYRLKRQACNKFVEYYYCNKKVG